MHSTQFTVKKRDQNKRIKRVIVTFSLRFKKSRKNLYLFEKFALLFNTTEHITFKQITHIECKCVLYATCAYNSTISRSRCNFRGIN